MWLGVGMLMILRYMGILFFRSIGIFLYGYDLYII